MTNSNLLKSKLIENGYTITSFAQKIGISKVSLSQKINNKTKFSQSNIRDIAKELNLSGDEIKNIFLN